MPSSGGIEGGIKVRNNNKWVHSNLAKIEATASTLSRLICMVYYVIYEQMVEEGEGRI